MHVTHKLWGIRIWSENRFSVKLKVEQKLFLARDHSNPPWILIESFIRELQLTQIPKLSF